MATYAIGDVQGCCTELELLLDRLAFNPARDRLWFVGDLVNRGPRSLDTLRLVKSLGTAAVVVLGNHDLHLLAVAAGAEPSKVRDTLAQVLTAPDRNELLAWLQQRPVLHHDAALGYTMIHAGLPAQWDFALARACARELEAALRDAARSSELFAHMYGDKPNRWTDSLRGFERLRFITNCFTRLRFCRADGQLELRYKGTVEQAPPEVMPWFRVPTRRSKTMRIICGHWSALGLHREAGVLSIDTGCVWGSKLCAVRLDRPGEPTLVPCTSSGLSVDGEA